MNGLGNRYVKTSLIAYLDSFVRTGEIDSVDDHADLQARLTHMSQNIIDYWEPVKQWSAYVTVFARYGQALSIAAIAAASVTYAAFRLKVEKDEQDKATHIHGQLEWRSTFKRGVREKEILKVLQMLSRAEGFTGVNIRNLYEEENDRRVSPQELKDILTYAEDYGLVKRKLGSVDGRPVVLWKNAGIHIASKREATGSGI